MEKSNRFLSRREVETGGVRCNRIKSFLNKDILQNIWHLFELSYKTIKINYIKMHVDV